jgi:hypothetical protein
MTNDSSIDRAWIASEFAKDVDAERSLAADALVRADSPPEPSMSVIYHEIAADVERHAAVVETIAVRYGHTPPRGVGAGIGAILGRIKDRVGELGSIALSRLSGDLAAKADAIHRHTAWVHTLTALGDAESARELAAVVAEEQTHRDALLESFGRLVEQAARGASGPPSDQPVPGSSPSGAEPSTRHRAARDEAAGKNGPPKSPRAAKPTKKIGL